MTLLKLQQATNFWATTEQKMLKVFPAGTIVVEVEVVEEGCYVEWDYYVLEAPEYRRSGFNFIAACELSPLEALAASLSAP